MKKYRCCWIAVLLCTIFFQYDTYASTKWDNTKTGYKAVIEDYNNHLKTEEEKAILAEMKKITKYGNVAYIITDESHANSELYADECFSRLFGEGNISGTVFLIDNEMIFLLTDGKMKKVITNSKAYSITDNTYGYAMKDDYYNCGLVTFEQIYTLLDGKVIPEPMRYICNILIALVLGLLCCYALIMKEFGKNRMDASDIIEGSKRGVTLRDVVITPNGKTKSVKIMTSSGSSHHSSHRVSGHRGGGHRSGGHHRSGGGHRR